MKKLLISSAVSALFALGSIGAHATQPSVSAGAGAGVSANISGNVSAANGSASLSHASNTQSVTITVAPTLSYGPTSTANLISSSAGITGTVATTGQAVAYNLSNGQFANGGAVSYGQANGAVNVGTAIEGLGSSAGVASSQGLTNVVAGTNQGGVQGVKTGADITLAQSASLGYTTAGGLVVTGSLNVAPTGDAYVSTSTGTINTASLANSAFDNGSNISPNGGIYNATTTNGSNVSGTAQFNGNAAESVSVPTLSAQNIPN